MKNQKDPLVTKAHNLALLYHKDQFRKSGEPYIIHCVATAEILGSWGITDPIMLAAALTHDLLEDTPLTAKELKKTLGADVCKIVEGVTKFIKTTGETDDFATKQKIAAEGFLDPRVSILKLADRLHNMQTLEFLPPHKQSLKAEETMTLYAPLAESLGMWVVKTQLEDLAYPYLDGRTFALAKKQIDSDERLNPNFLETFTKPIKAELKKHGISAKIELKRNGIRAVWKKREKSAFFKTTMRTTFESINDLVSVRVLCGEKNACYRVLGLIHTLFLKEIDPERFDEFIVSPRTNGYQALQTTLNTPKGALEIAIATEAMERFNNWGVVSLFNQKSAQLSDYTRKIIFTQGDRVWYLPKESTALDLAYLINPSLGRDAHSVTINGVKSHFSDVVPNAARVHFQIGPERVSRGIRALQSVALPRTKAFVRQELANAEWEEMVKKGKDIIEKKLESQKRGIFELSNIERKLMVPFFFLNGCKSLSELHYKVGIGNVSWSSIELYLTSLGYLANNPNQTGFRLIGTKAHDKPGVLAGVAAEIAKNNGNILYVDNARLKKDQFQTVFIVTGINKKTANEIEVSLRANKKFALIRCV